MPDSNILLEPMREIVMQSAAPSLVNLSNIRKSYDGNSDAVADLNLEIRNGEFLSLLGPSGSGKTSTLMMLAGFEAPTSGDILMDGRSITTVPPHKRGIGVVFQNYALFPHMTIAENVAYPLRARKWDKQKIGRKVNQALEMVKLTEFRDRRPKTLSGGQQQRAALARALVFDPSLVLMDEPLGALDRQLREHMLLEIKRLHRDLAVTIVYVTHDQSEALALSDRIAIFNHGRVQQLGTAAQIYERPANAFVAGFVGENNLIRGKIESIADGSCKVRVSGGDVVSGTVAGNLSVGDAAIVSIRPDRVLATGNHDAQENVFRGRVDQATYRGDSVCYTVPFGGSEAFAVRLATRATNILPTGCEIHFAWHAQDALVFQAN